MLSCCRCLFDQIKATLANIQPENLQNVQKKRLGKKLQESMGYWYTLYKSWNASCKLKTNKNERVIWGIEFGLTEMCFPSSGSRHKYKLTMAASLLFSLQIMGRGPWAPSLDLPLFSYIGRCPENSFDNLNITPQYVKRIAMTFSFCWLIIWVFQLLSRKYPFRN